MPNWPSRAEGIHNKMRLLNGQAYTGARYLRVTTEREGIRTLGWRYPPQPAYTGCCLNQRQPLHLYYNAIAPAVSELRRSTVLSSVIAGFGDTGFVNSVEHFACLKVEREMTAKL